MKSGTLIDLPQGIPSRLQEEIHKKFPNKDLNELTIRYYESVEDVGYEYFTEKVLATSNDESAVRYLGVAEKIPQKFMRPKTDNSSPNS